MPNADDIIKSAKSLILVLPEELDEWADCQLYRMVQDRIERLENAIKDYEKEEKEEVDFIKNQIEEGK